MKHIFDDSDTAGMEPDAIESMKSHYRRIVQRFLSFLKLHKVDIITSMADLLVSQPFVLLRRQCQVQPELRTYHLSPTSLLPVAATLLQRKGLTALFAGAASAVLLRAARFAVETALSRASGWPRHLPPTWHVNGDWARHFALKTASYAATFPLYSRTVLDAVAADFWVADYECCPPCDLPLPLCQRLPPAVAYELCKFAFGEAVSSVSSALLYLRLSFDERGHRQCRQQEGGLGLEDRQDILLTASVVSYFSAEAVFYPLETVVHRLIVQGSRALTNDLDSGLSTVRLASAYSGLVDCFDRVVWLEGRLGLYKGVGALLVHALVYHYAVKAVNCVWRSVRLVKRSLGRD